MPTFTIEPLADHNRTDFSCGVEVLDNYFQRQLTQDMRRRVCAGFVAVANESNQVAGYYTLSASSLLLAELPETITKRLPRYPSVPVARLGRLAVDKRYQGQRLGEALLWDAYNRAARAELMAFALVVDAKDEKAKAFYTHYGFFTFGSLPLQLLLSLPKNK